MSPFEGMSQHDRQVILSDLPFFAEPVSVPPPMPAEVLVSSPPAEPASGGTPIKRGPGRPKKGSK